MSNPKPYVCSAITYGIAKQLCKEWVVVGLHKLGKHFVLVSVELVHIRAVTVIHAQHIDVYGQRCLALSNRLPVLIKNNIKTLLSERL